MQALDVVNPRARAPMRELGEIRERRGPEIDQVLALQVAARAFAGDGGHALGAVLGQDRARAGLELPRMLGAEAPGDDPHAIAIEIQRARQAQSRRAASSTDGRRASTTPGRADTHRESAAPDPPARLSAAAAGRAPRRCASPAARRSRATAAAYSPR